MAAGKDGAFYVNDWVFSSYPIHKRGRLWKLEIDRTAATWVQPTPEPLNDAARLAKGLRDGTVARSEPELFELAKGGDAYLSDAALTALARQSGAWTAESPGAAGRGPGVGLGGAASGRPERWEMGARSDR
ncbi:MAG: hypothetical protein R3F31_26005 [Verrucomicrobiales bacterium]